LWLQKSLASVVQFLVPGTTVDFIASVDGFVSRDVRSAIVTLQHAFWLIVIVLATFTRFTDKPNELVNCPDKQQYKYQAENHSRDFQVFRFTVD
jgi:hypothetical protein